MRSYSVPIPRVRWFPWLLAGLVLGAYGHMALSRRGERASEWKMRETARYVELVNKVSGQSFRLGKVNRK